MSREQRSWDRRQFTPQLSSESDGDPVLGNAPGLAGQENEILSRWEKSYCVSYIGMVTLL